MLLRNNTKIINKVLVDLYFDDNSEKHVEISEKDIISIAYNDNGYRREIEGKVTRIVPASRIMPPPDRMYRVEPMRIHDSMPNSEAFITVDGSGVYDGKKVNIYLSHILDCEMIEKYDETLFVKTVPAGQGSVNKIQIKEGKLQVSQDNGVTWINVSDLLGTDNIPGYTPDDNTTEETENTEDTE